MAHTTNWIRKSKRLAIYIRDNFTCAYCGTNLKDCDPRDISLDHLTPRCQKGSNHESNLITACTLCNSTRQDRPWQDFAPGGAQARILFLIHQPLNLKLAKALIAGTVGNPELEDLR